MTLDTSATKCPSSITWSESHLLKTRPNHTEASDRYLRPAQPKALPFGVKQGL